MKTAIGIDIGGTNTKIALVDAKGNILARKQLTTASSNNVDEYFQAIFSKIAQLRREEGDPAISGLGIGAPGCNEQDGTIERTANLIIKEQVPIRTIFSEYYQRPAYLIKDSNAAALGEKLFGGARRMDNFVLFTLGTGLGCGIFLNGQLVRGNSGLASEMGHITISGNDRICGCGRKGCLETYISATGLRRTVFQLMAERNLDSPLRRYSYSSMTAKIIADAAAAGDALALAAFDCTAKVLARTIADLSACFEPEAVFLSGGLALSGDLLLQPTRKYLEEQVLYLVKGKTRIFPSSLGANDAALLGAASLALFNQKEKIL